MSADSALAPSSSPAPTTVPPFDQVAVAIAPGDDLVVRMPGILLVVGVDATPAPPPSAPKLGGWGAAPAKPPAAAPVGDTKVGELVALCRRVSAAGSRAPGRRLHDELRRWLPTVAELPSFALAAATEEGLAVALVGEGVAEVPDLGLRLTPADGERLQDGTRFLDRLVDWPPAPLRLSAGASVDMAPHPLADLEAGAVPGAAAVLSPAVAPAPVAAPDSPSPTALVRLPSPGSLLPPPPGAPVPAAAKVPPVAAAPAPPLPPPAPSGRDVEDAAHAGHDHADHDHDHAGHVHAAPAPAPAAPPPAPEPVAPPAPPPVELPAPALSASLLAPPEEEVPREPLPVLDSEQPPAALAQQEPEDTRPKVKGFLCSRGHLNDPRVLFCNLCGIRMAQQTGVFVEGIRPPLGLLVFDNGATVNLDMDYLLGREPETDERVQGGQLRPLLVVDQTGGVSRHHAEIRLEGWDVTLVDIGSANGTLVAPPGAPAWSSLVPNQPVRLVPGMAVRMGSRQFAFESPHGAT
ncbi:FHA domain-containing protein [Blastococcus sp. SYSU D00669]